MEKQLNLWYNASNRDTEKELLSMLKHSEDKQLSFYSQLYYRIPEKHILKIINSAISFKFVNKMLETSYCKNFGRPAKELEMMLRILLLQYLYNLSDERIIQELQVNLAYMWFVGINPDEELPHPSLLAKFRMLRLKDVSLDEIITGVVRQCVEKKIINSENGIAIDTTHIGILSNNGRWIDNGCKRSKWCIRHSNQWLCIMGNKTNDKAIKKEMKRKKEHKYFVYSFKREHCINCPKRNECIGKAKTIGKKLRVSANAPECYEYNQRAKTEEFLHEYKKRAPIEGKNAEMKRFHGLAHARGYGLISVGIQARLTALAVNLKRIAKLVSPLNHKIQQFFLTFSVVSNRPLCRHMSK